MTPLLLACLLLPQAQRVQAETGTLYGTTIQSARANSEQGFVTGFDADSDRVELRVPARSGIYRVTIAYAAPSEKGYVLNVNGVRYSGMFEGTGTAFKPHDAGLVELRDGENSIAIEKGWGYFDIDWLEIQPASTPARLKPISPTPIDKSASPQVKTTLKRLASLYGSKTMSGQYDPKEISLINEISGKRSAILGFDFMDYSPSRIARGADTDLLTERMIRYGKMGYLLTASWHWNAPTGLLDKKYKNDRGETIDASWYKGFYTNATTFDLEKTLVNPASPEYKLILRDIDAIAVQLKKFQAANLPVLWRPLHEAEGRWFWWGAKGPESCKKLWRLLYHRLTDHHKLHNLIWVYSSGTKPEWYPGDRYVDIVGVDLYPSDAKDPLAGTWEKMLKQYDGRKLIALTEIGGVPDIDRMFKFGVRWSYFVTWVGNLGPSKTPADDVKRIYNSPLTVVKD